MTELKNTPLSEVHKTHGARMVDFGGWNMPVQYKDGVIQEHLADRKQAGLFDVSHMGRFTFSGKDALPLLQHVLTNDAAALSVGQSQYTILADETGGAVDDAYLYRFLPDEYLLVVNASNTTKDRERIESFLYDYPEVRFTDQTAETAMLSLQGPRSEDMIQNLIESGETPKPRRNANTVVTLAGVRAFLARTGYTGDPVGFEMIFPAAAAVEIWKRLIDKGAVPVGLGARDTLRLEAGLPLYGHEYGTDPGGNEIPVFACPLAKFAVNFSERKGTFSGKPALEKQFQALGRIRNGDTGFPADLPRRIRPVAVTGKGIVRAGAEVFRKSGEPAGWVTSGTMVPYWKMEGEGNAARLTDETGMRAVALALVDSDLAQKTEIDMSVRGKKIPGIIVPRHMRGDIPPFVQPVLWTA